MSLSIHSKLLFQLMAGFFLATIVGTLSHEAGHWLGAQQYIKPGTAHINYMSINWEEKDNLGDTLYKLSQLKEPTKEQEKQHEDLSRKYVHRKLVGKIGGPLITIITGSLGVLLLLLYKGTPDSRDLPWRYWGYIFLALFWLRPVYIFLGWVIMQVANTGRSRCDEIGIAELLQVPQGTIMIPTGLLGIAVAIYVFFFCIPKPIRFTFLMAAIIGCPLSYLIWFYWLGPLLLP